jgi:hypothetical protein
MSAKTNTIDQYDRIDRESNLERKLIAEYLLEKGFRISDLKRLPEEEQKTMMREACMHAALRMAHIEAKSKFRRKIEFP